MWLKLAGVDGIDSTRGPVFTTEALTLDAAIEGQGVALVNQKMITSDITSGRLVVPFELSLTSDWWGFYVVCPESTADLPKNAAFRWWLLDEVGGREISNGVTV